MGGGRTFDPYADRERVPQVYRCPGCKVEAKPGEWMKHMAGCRFEPSVKAVVSPPENDF